MSKYAEVIVDIPVRKFNKPYDYIIPDNLLGKVDIGTAVIVGFGNRKLRGFVINLKDKTELQPEQIKEVKKLISPSPFFSQKDLKLYRWISKYYCALLIDVLKAAVPTAVFKGKIRKKVVKMVELNIKKTDINKYLVQLKNKAPSQYKVLKYFKEDPSQIVLLNNLIKEVDVYRGSIDALEKKEILKKSEQIKRRIPYKDFDQKLIKDLDPSKEQQRALDIIKKDLFNKKSKTYLLHGVTGSGKTEIYIQLIRKVINKDRSAILLVPEISLTPVMVKRFYSRFGEKIAILHSGLSTGEKYDEWRSIKKGKAKIVIGARSAIFAPVKNLGIIIIDEEHENSYKQNNSPYYHAREVAKKRANLNNIDLILGTATPSLESYHQAVTKEYVYLSLPNRIDNKVMPPVKIIDMKEELKEGNPSIFSRFLQKKLKEALKKNEQAILFLNRRGYSSFVMCRSCGHVIRCDNCDISMTYHKKEDKLICHYCGQSKEVFKNCPNCNSRYIKDFGVGTERIENEMKELLPQARVIRMDMDTTIKKGSHRRILKKLENKEIDILIGTQMVAKGHDYPNISFVGVITADTIMNLPDFRSSERTFQLLTQVAGRTGRGEKDGIVAIQTYNPDHYSVLAAKEHDYQYFYQKEIELRKVLKYPPFTYLINIITLDKDKAKAKSALYDLDRYVKNTKIKMEIIGPSPAPIEKIRNNYRFQLLLKFNKIETRIKALNKIKSEYLTDPKYNVKYNIDVDPISML
ncbi:MAG: primosomal protein N' [Halanaerobiales bacterium]|nr:primosomal protein N' [Halanaerobiales bacterium]